VATLGTCIRVAHVSWNTVSTPAIRTHFPWLSSDVPWAMSGTYLEKDTTTSFQTRSNSSFFSHSVIRRFTALETDVVRRNSLSAGCKQTNIACCLPATPITLQLVLRKTNPSCGCLCETLTIYSFVCQHFVSRTAYRSRLLTCCVF